MHQQSASAAVGAPGMEGAHPNGIPTSFLQVLPAGTTDDVVQRMLVGFRGARSVAEAGKYRSVTLTAVDEAGSVLFQGPVVP